MLVVKVKKFHAIAMPQEKYKKEKTVVPSHKERERESVWHYKSFIQVLVNALSLSHGNQSIHFRKRENNCNCQSINTTADKKRNYCQKYGKSYELVCVF